MKWGTKYGPEYVNRLYNTAKRNLTLPFRFVCYTDDSKNFESGIEARPLPEMEIPNDNERGWRKLALFRKDVGLEGRVLFMDLDTVIVANIDDYFTVDGDFIFIRHWKPSKKQGVGQTSVYRFEAGVLDFLYANFIANMPKYRAQYRHEQAYVSGELGKLGRLRRCCRSCFPALRCAASAAWGLPALERKKLEITDKNGCAPLVQLNKSFVAGCIKSYKSKKR